MSETYEAAWDEDPYRPEGDCGGDDVDERVPAAGRGHDAGGAR